MKKGNCSICLKPIDIDEAAILTMSGAGNPRCICDECANDIDNATTGYDVELISSSIDKIANTLTKNNVDDPLVINTVATLLTDAAKRLKKLLDGELDAMEEDPADAPGEAESFEEIPEELLESEEDKALDAEDEKKAEKLDRVLNWVWLAVLVLAVGFMVWWFFFR